jgi:hypothetical protein
MAFLTRLSPWSFDEDFLTVVFMAAHRTLARRLTV